MNELVILKNNDIFTDSLIIAKGTKIAHRYIKEQIRKHENRFKTFGLLVACATESTGGRPEEYYQLNEEQATFLITLLKNTDIVVDFKMELVKQFYAMRKLLLEKQTSHWLETRQQSKSNRKLETDEIKNFVEYAKSNGSQNADRYYTSLTKLANSIIGIVSNQRDDISVSQLNNLILIENIIGHVIVEGIKRQLYYKDIYKDCKARLEMFKDLTYLELTA